MVKRTYVVGNNPRFFEVLQGAQDGVMLHAGRNDVVTFLQDAEKSDVQGFRTVFGENDTVKAVPVEKHIQCVAAILHEGGAGDGKLVSASPCVGAGFDGSLDGGKHLVGFSASRCGVVKINHHEPLCLKYHKIYYSEKETLMI